MGMEKLCDSNKILKEIDNTFNGLIKDYYTEFVKEHPLSTEEGNGVWLFYQFLKSK
jgi:hypothetical protein